MSKKSPSWDHLKSFLFVLRSGSLSAAARELGLKQSTVGRQIDALEKDLGVPLFTRSPKGLRPTDAALKLRPHLNAFSLASEALIRDADSDDSDSVGTIRLTTAAPIGHEILPEVFLKLRSKYPRIKFEISISGGAEDLLSRQADIAIRAGPVLQKALLAKKITELEMGLFGSRAYFRGRKKPESFADLGSHTLIGFDAERARAARIMKVPEFLLRDDLSYLTDDAILQSRLVDSGCGLGLCLVAGAARPDRVRVLEDVCTFRIGLWVAMHENLKANRKFRAVFNELASALREAF